jgi:hypothetical protein
MRLEEVTTMIHHVQSTFLSETNTPTTGQSGSASPSRSDAESFHGLLSDAVGPDPRASTAHEAAKESEEFSGKSLVRGPINSDTLVRTVSATPAQPATGANSVEPSTPLPIPPAPTTPATYPTPAATSSTTPAPDAQEAFDNAYWAEQPAAVQALRTMPQSQRATAAAQLASEGYSIDVPIMVWGWDPSIVTSMREAEGYTWVPSAMQNPVEMLPGLPSMGGLTAYNPNNAPAGSITV